MSYKIFGQISQIDEPNREKNLQSFVLEVTNGEKVSHYPFTMFERALTQENVQHVFVGNDVTVEFFLNSKDAVSAAGNTYYKLSLSVNKVEQGNTTGETIKQPSAPSQVVFAGDSADDLFG